LNRQARRVDLAIPSPDRQKELEAAYTLQKDTGAPYQGIAIHTVGEIYWIMQQRNWSGAHNLPEGMERGNFIGADLRGAHLRKARLHGVNFSKADLSKANLYKASLDNACLDEAILCAVDMRKTMLTGTTFKDADITNIRLKGAFIDGPTLLTNPYFAQLERNGAPYLSDDVLLRKRSSRIDYQRSARAYRKTANELRTEGLLALASYYRLRGERIETRGFLVQRKLLSWIGALILDLVSGYGERPNRAFLSYAAVILTFAGCNYWVTNYLSGSATTLSKLTWDESLVLSITSFHGRGFFPGYLQLSDWIARIGAVEAIIGLLIELVFLAAFSRRFLGN
jgi:uncharacterized protein YjbI with pentapeptide repeats